MAQEQQRAATKKRRVVWWIVGGLLGALILLPQLVISIWGSALAGRLLTHELKKPVSIQKVSGGWWGGLEIEGLTIFDSFEGDAKTLLEIGRVNLGGPVWLLVLPGETIDLVADEMRIELRRLADGEWNVASLQPASDTEMPEHVLLPIRGLTVRLTRGQIYLQPEDREYSLVAEANSLSLRNQPLEWSIRLSATEGESLSASGSFTNLGNPRELTGSAEMEMARLDLAIIPALVPQLPLMYPDGTVKTGKLQISLTGFEQLRAQADFELRDISLPDIGQKTDVKLPYGSIRLAVTRNHDKWTVETLSLEGPHGNLILAPGAWFEISEKAVQGKLDFHARLDDARPGSRALGMLIPDPLSLAGPLSIRAVADGKVSLDSRRDLHERLANLKASFELTLAEAQWKQETLKDIVADFDIAEGRLSVTKLGALVGKGQVGIQGDLASGGAGLSWLITHVQLAKVLGPPVQTFDITKASGRLTSDGETYRFESQTAIRELAFDRAALGNRALRINNANLNCTGLLTSDLTQLNINECRLKAVQGDLSSKKATIDLAVTPNLAVDLRGWLSGPFLSGLVPEFTPKWPARINVSGHLMVPFTGAVWPNMEWELAASGKDFTYEKLEFKNLEARVTKSVGRLDFNISGKRGGGSLVTSGSLELGDKDVTTLEIKATRIPIHRKLEGSFSLEATVSGSTKVTIDAEGQRGFLDNQLMGVKLRRGREVAANLESAKLRGDLKQTRRGGLWAKDLSLVGPQLNIRIHDSHLPLEGGDAGALKLNADFSGNGSWLALATALGGAAKVRPAGDSQMSIRLQGKAGRTLESATGTGTLKVAELYLWDHPFSNADVAFELHPREIKITRGLVKYRNGKVALEGNVILPLERGDRNEHVVLQLGQVPVFHSQTLASFKGGGPAKLTNEAIINGRVSLDGTANGQLALTADIKTGPISRRLLRGKQNLATVELPALHFETKLLSRKPLQGWTTTSVDIRGTGVSIQLTDGQLLREKGAYGIAGALSIEMSSEFLEAMALGLIPTEIKPAGKIAAVGQAKLRVPSEGAMGLANVEFRGTLKNEQLIIDADTISSLRLAIHLARGRLDVAEGEASLLGGRVWLPTRSSINLTGPAHEFNIHVAAKDLQLKTYGGRQVSLGKFLGLLIPVFLFTSDSDKPVGVKGVLQTDLQLEGVYQHLAGWSRSVNGKGSFRIDDGAVTGSSLLSGILAKSLLMPTNVVHNSVAALFSREGKVGRALTGLGDRAFTFQTIESPITIRNGEIFLKKDLTVTSPELTLTINGHSNLEGVLDYDVGTDLIKRVRLGEITDLPNKIPVIGKVIGFLNPFTYLDGIELRAKVTGNLLKTGPDGQSDVHVKTSVIDTKKG